jgi:hypothetical protein
MTLWIAAGIGGKAKRTGRSRRTGKMRSMHNFVHVASPGFGALDHQLVSFSALPSPAAHTPASALLREPCAWPELIARRQAAIGLPPAETPSARPTRVPSYFPNGRGRNVRLAA